MSSIKRRPGPIDRGVPQKRYDDYDVRFEWIFQSKQFFSSRVDWLNKFLARFLAPH